MSAQEELESVKLASLQRALVRDGAADAAGQRKRRNRGLSGSNASFHDANIEGGNQTAMDMDDDNNGAGRSTGSEADDGSEASTRNASQDSETPLEANGADNHGRADIGAQQNPVLLRASVPTATASSAVIVSKSGGPPDVASKLSGAKVVPGQQRNAAQGAFATGLFADMSFDL